MDHAALVLRARSGDPAAREALARAWLGRVYAVALAVAGRAADAEDATQEAFLRAFGRLGRLRAPERFGPWIAQIARNAARDRLRRRDRSRPLHGEPAEEKDPAGPLARREALDAWRRLPEAERLVVWLRVVDALPFREIAELTGRTKSAVDRTYRRAMARLRKEMERCRPASR